MPPLSLMDTIAQIRQTIAEEFRQFENLYEQTMRSENVVLDQVLRYISAKRGKQLRPTLVLLAAKLCREVSDKSVRTAVAMEMLHNASLVHDDVVDGSAMRHGVPAVHERWSNKVAVLVGDWMLSRVIGALGEIRNAQILTIVSRMARALTSGELIQLHAGNSMWIGEKQYFDIIGKKTAELFAACTEAGAVSAGASSRQQTAMRTYGYELGLIFQLKDDVLDYSDSEELGKPTMGDIRDGNDEWQGCRAVESHGYAVGPVHVARLAIKSQRHHDRHEANNQQEHDEYDEHQRFCTDCPAIARVHLVWCLLCVSKV